MDYVDEDVQSCHDDRVVESFEGAEEEDNEGVQLILELLLYFDGRQLSLLMLITNQNQASLLQGLAKALETEVSKYSTTYLLRLLLGDVLGCLDPLDLNSMTLLHSLFNCLPLEHIVNFGAIVASCLLIIYFSFHGHSDTLLNDGIE